MLSCEISGSRSIFGRPCIRGFPGFPNLNFAAVHYYCRCTFLDCCVPSMPWRAMPARSDRHWSGRTLLSEPNIDQRGVYFLKLFGDNRWNQQAHDTLGQDSWSARVDLSKAHRTDATRSVTFTYTTSCSECGYRRRLPLGETDAPAPGTQTSHCTTPQSLTLLYASMASIDCHQHCCIRSCLLASLRSGASGSAASGQSCQEPC
jgi:hypothetical protein